MSLKIEQVTARDPAALVALTNDFLKDETWGLHGVVLSATKTKTTHGHSGVTSYHTVYTQFFIKKS